jgi:hypothetical protein
LSTGWLKTTYAGTASLSTNWLKKHSIGQNPGSPVSAGAGGSQLADEVGLSRVEAGGERGLAGAVA